MTYFKIASGGACLGSTIALYSVKNKVQAKETIDCHECRVKRLPKARELPIYEKEDDNLRVEFDDGSKPPLVSEISGIRQKTADLLSYLSVAKEETVHIYETGLAHTQSTYDYINNEENKIPRYLTIASGGLTGLFLARKGGLFKKLVYTSAGTGVVFSAFYPAIAKEYASSLYEFGTQQGGKALEYGGYDSEKLAKETNEKLEIVKSTMKLDGLTSKLNEWFYKGKESLGKSLNNKEESLKTKDDVSTASPKQSSEPK